jgi:4-hydroxyproline epimerase
MTAALPARMVVVDSHTEGEPTRVVIDGWPQLIGSTMAERRDDLRARFHAIRSAVVCEPRGHDAVVGALLTPPTTPGSAAGVVFFNNVDCLGMCGHGLIGVARTLEHLGRLQPGPLTIDTPVGTVGAELGEDGSVTIRNVPAFCHRLDVSVEVPGLGAVTGDIAYGGNWFFITHLPGLPLSLDQLEPLTRATRSIVGALRERGITGAGGAEIDHVEVTGPSFGPHADARNFVLCPGGAYDRSPCGTGTSAKMATMLARAALSAGEPWRQESITGGLFTGWLERDGEALIPYIRGRAFVTGETTLIFDPEDPFRTGFSAAGAA